MKVLIIEANALLRESIMKVLHDWKPDVLVHGYESTEDLDSALPVQYDLIILKIADSNLSVGAFSKITDIAPNTSVVCLVDTVDRKIVRQLIQSGSKAIITNTASSDEFKAVLQLVIAGGIFVPSDLFHSPSDSNLDNDQYFSTQSSSHASEIYSTYGLSGRQIEVLELLCLGQSNKVISDKMCLSIHTVKAHLTSIFKLLSVKNRTEAVAMLTRSSTNQPDYQQRNVSKLRR